MARSVSPRERSRATTAPDGQPLECETKVLRALMNGARTTHLAYLDRDFNFVCANETYARSCGCTPEELTGKSHFVLFPNEENEAIFARVRDSGIPAELHDKPFEYPDQPERGVTYWDWTLHPVKDASGKVEGLVLSLVETTERKRAEIAKAQSAARLALVANVTARLLAAEDPQAIIDDICVQVMAHLDCDVFFNFLADEPSGRLRLNAYGGVSAVQARRVSWLDYGVGVCGSVARDGRRIVAEHLPSAPDPRTEMAASFGLKAYACHPLLGPEGRILGTLSFGTRSRETFSDADLEAMRSVANQVAVAMMRLQSQADLRASEDRYRKLVEQAEDGIFVSDEQGRFLDVNDAGARIFGYTREEILGRSILDMIDPEEASRVAPEMARFKTGRVVLSKWRCRRKDGTFFSGEVLGRQLSNGRFQAVLRDITGREREQQRLDARTAVTQILAEAASLDDAAPMILQEIGARLGWSGAELWMVGAAADRLRCVGSWLARGSGLDEMEGVSRSLAYRRGEGVPGRVWKSGRPVRVENPAEGDSDARLALAWRLGVQCVSGFPVRLGRKLLGVIVLLATERRERDAGLAKTLEVIGSQIGQFVQRKRAEADVARLHQDLQRRVAELEAFLDTVPVGLAIVSDPDGHHILGNATLEHMTGVARGGEFSKSAARPPEYRVLSDGRELPVEDLPMQRAVRGEPVVGRRLQIVRPDGVTSTVISSATPLLDEDGRPRGAVGAFLDITALQEAEEARRRTEARYRNLFDTMNEGFAVHELLCDDAGRPADYRFLEVNPAFERLTGLRAEDVVGRTVREVLPDTEPLWIERFGRVALTGEPESFEGFHQGLGRWYSVHAFHTAPRQFAVIFIDVTERREAEQAIHRAKEEWERTFDAVPDLIAIMDEHYRIVRTNKAMAARLGLTPGQCLGAKCPKLVHGTGKPPQICPHALTLRDGQEHVAELHEPHLGGDFLVSTTPVRDAEGRLVGSVHVARDITERKQLEERLRAGEERLTLATEEAGMATWDTDLATGTAVWSRRNFELLGCEPTPNGEASWEMWEHRLHPADLERVLADIERARRERGPYATTYRIIRADTSQIRWLRSFGRFLYDDEGRPRRFVGISFDDTALQEAARFIEATGRAAPGAAAPRARPGTGTSLRRSGIEPVGGVPWGTHFCQFYETAEDLIETLVPYFQAGLEDNEFCMWVTSAPLGVEQAVRALRSAVPGLDRYLETGQIEIIDYRDWYVRSGKFDAEAVLRGWVDKLEAARKRGFDGLRLTGNTFWLERANWQDFYNYESAVNGVIGRYPMLALCSYSLQKCGVAEVVDVIANHRFALVKRAGHWDSITSADQKSVEDALRQSDERLRLATWSADLGVFDWDMETGRASWENPRMFQIFGQAEQDGPLDKVQLLSLAIVPEDVPIFETALSEGRQPGRLFQATCRIRRRNDGALRWVEFAGRFERDPSANPVRLLGVVSDVTERVRAEEDLRRREQEYRELMENASDGMVLVDASGRLATANARACEMLGYGSQGDLCRVPLADLLPAEEIPLLRSQLDAAAGRGSAILEHRVLRRDGTWIHVETNIRGLADGRYQAILRDVSERKRAEEEFRRAVAAQALDRLLSMLREFRHGEGLAMNLHRIALFAKNVDLLQNRPGDQRAPSSERAVMGSSKPPARERLEVAVREFRSGGLQTLLNLASLLSAVEREIDRGAPPGDEPVTGGDIRSLAERLSADLAELMEIVATNGTADPTRPAAAVGDRIAELIESLQRKLATLTRRLRALYTADLSDVAGTVVQSFHPATPGTVIHLEDLCPGLRALISPSDLNELLRLLIVNSFEALAGTSPAAGDTPGSIVVRVRAAGDAAILEVDDTGPGVSRELHERIFEKGFSTKGAGRGHGLSFAIEHLAKYGGRLSYDETYRDGARFRIELVRV